MFKCVTLSAFKRNHEVNRKILHWMNRGAWMGTFIDWMTSRLYMGVKCPLLWKGKPGFEDRAGQLWGYETMTLGNRDCSQARQSEIDPFVRICHGNFHWNNVGIHGEVDHLAGINLPRNNNEKIACLCLGWNYYCEASEETIWVDGESEKQMWGSYLQIPASERSLACWQWRAGQLMDSRVTTYCDNLQQNLNLICLKWRQLLGKYLN